MLIAVIPAYNESPHIATVLNEVRRFVDTIVVVDDGSTDDTALVAEETGATVLRHLVNRGQGAALQTGTAYALSRGAEIIVHFDADGQFSAAQIPAVIAPIKEGSADVVIGSRFLNNASAVPFIKRFVLFPAARIVDRWYTGVALTDVHNGFRALSRAAALRLRITQDRMAHNSDIVAHIREHNLRFVEVPVRVSYERFGQGLGGGIKIVKDMVVQKFFVS